MRAFAFLFASTLLLIGAAFAQDATRTLNITNLQWQQRPDASFARLYPQAAQDRMLPGVAVVCCSIREDRRLDCQTAFEWPQGYGFGDATLQVMRDFRLTQASYDEVMAGPDRDLPIRQTLRWSLPQRMTPETESAFARISEAAQTMCATPVS